MSKIKTIRVSVTNYIEIDVDSQEKIGEWAKASAISLAKDLMMKINRSSIANDAEYKVVSVK